MEQSADDSVDPNLATLLGHAGVSAGIAEAVGKPSGARFYKCALQVNPFEYAKRHAKRSAYANEADYNAAIVAACLNNGVEVVGITDHFRVETSRSLAEALREAPIHVFVGFEASSSEGVHLLCLFPATTALDELQRTVGACGVTDLSADSPQSDKTFEQLLEIVPTRGGITIAAHVCSASGLLTTLKGQARARTWKCEHLLAAALPGSRDSAPENCRDIMANKDPAFSRPRPLAVINANDVSDPAALSDPSTTTWIKMAVVSIEGLRQAFLDWESRVRLNSEPTPSPHTELIAASWVGGLLDDQSLRFNESLNVLVGGRGAGKSTLIESLRFALELPPKGDEAKRSHENMVKNLLGQGASISVLVRSPLPSPQYYLIERVFGSRARVRDQSGELLQSVSPQSILGNLEVYGQHEISELTRHPEKLAHLLRRFTEPTIDATPKKVALRDDLERSRNAIVTELAEINKIEEALAALPTLREHLKRFTAAGLDAKLKQKTSTDKEAGIFERADEIIAETNDLADTVVEQGTLEQALVGDDAKDLPNAAIVSKLDGIQTALLKKIEAAGKSIRIAALEAVKSINAVKAEWTPKQVAAEQIYQTTLRELKAAGHDAGKYVAIKKQVEQLKPKEAQLKIRKGNLSDLQKKRRELLARWDDLKAQDFRELQKAARKVSKRLKDRVRVSVRRSSTREQLEAVIRRHCSGNISQALERLRLKDELNLTELAAAVTDGSTKLIREYGFSQGSAERIAQGGMDLALELEECEIPAEAALELNVGTEGLPVWKELDQLSTGQKATAVLLLLLLESDAPLIVDQPEDDLDNRFIAECIVPAMREEKRRRQFIFSTHNANIPVLGDAEQIIGMTAVVEGGIEHATIPDELRGSIDTPSVKDLVKELLEGGQEAFEFRRKKYGF